MAANLVGLTGGVLSDVTVPLLKNLYEDIVIFKKLVMEG